MSHSNQLLQVIAANRGSTSYRIRDVLSFSDDCMPPLFTTLLYNMQLFVPKHTKEHTNMLHTKTVVTAHLMHCLLGTMLALANCSQQMMPAG